MSTEKGAEKQVTQEYSVLKKTAFPKALLPEIDKQNLFIFLSANSLDVGYIQQRINKLKKKKSVSDRLFYIESDRT